MGLSEEPIAKIADFNANFKQFKTATSVKKPEMSSELQKTLKTEIPEPVNSFKGISARVRDTRRSKNHSKAIKALQIMARRGASRETMEAMLALLRKGGWKDAKSLPQGWMVRNRTIPRSKNGDYTLVTYLSPRFDLFQSHPKVLAFLQESGAGDDILESIREENETKRSRTGNAAPSLKEATNAFDWQEDESLPPGWKVAYYTPNLGSMKVFVISSKYIHHPWNLAGEAFCQAALTRKQVLCKSSAGSEVIFPSYFLKRNQSPSTFHSPFYHDIFCPGTCWLTRALQRI